MKEESRQLLDKGGRALKAAETLLREGDAEVRGRVGGTKTVGCGSAEVQ